MAIVWHGYRWVFRNLAAGLEGRVARVARVARARVQPEAQWLDFDEIPGRLSEIHDQFIDH